MQVQLPLMSGLEKLPLRKEKNDNVIQCVKTDMIKIASAFGENTSKQGLYNELRTFVTGSRKTSYVPPFV